MSDKNNELLKRLLPTFKLEAEEHINAISSGLFELETASSSERQVEIIEATFREAHSLKGAARSVNFAKVEAACQSLENIFASLKAKKTALSPEIFSELHQGVNSLDVLLSEVLIPRMRIEGSQPVKASETVGSTKIPEVSKGSIAPEDASSPLAESVARLQRTEEERPEQPETLRVSAGKLDSFLRQVEELIPIKTTAAYRLGELREIRETLALCEKERGGARFQTLGALTRSEQHRQYGSARRSSTVSQNHGTQSAKTVAGQEKDDARLRSISDKLAILAKHLEGDRRLLERRVDELLEDTKRVMMVPFSSFLGIFPKLVRELCRDCGKDARLEIVGGEIEADKRILEEMKDPLIHLVRNCVDHGIEIPTLRTQRGKPPKATIRIAIQPKSADQVEITVSDDGAGVELEQVRLAAAKLKRMSPNQSPNLEERDALSLIFESAVSTSPMITEVSGRGLGLAIVREKVLKVGGSVSVETQPGAGTTFRLVLPVTLARLRGIVVRIGEELFVLPTTNVQRVLRISQDSVKTVENRETVPIDGQATSLVRLGAVLGISRTPGATDPKRKMPVVLVAAAGNRIAFMVDAVISEQELLVKSLGKQLVRLRNVTGAMVSETGSVLPVLNVVDLMRSATSGNAGPVAVGQEPESVAKSVLVAEDSITARTLLKSILESAGYRVKTAVDGAEALSALVAEDFDLLVSDVDMPRMSGFDLTAKIRADKSLHHLPVVLVTSLESRQDRERGIDAGANAYVLKSGFDQENLLEVVRRLI